MFQLQNLQIVFLSYILEYGYNKVVKLAGSQLKPQILFILRCKYLSECHDTQHNDIEHNDTQPSDTQHNGLACDTQHNITQYDGTVCCVSFRGILSVVVLYVVMLSAVITECRGVFVRDKRCSLFSRRVNKREKSFKRTVSRLIRKPLTKFKSLIKL